MFYVATDTGAYEIGSSSRDIKRLSDESTSSLLSYDGQFFKVNNDNIIKDISSGVCLTNVHAGIVAILENRFGDVMLTSLRKSQKNGYLELTIYDDQNEKTLRLRNPFPDSYPVSILQQDLFLYVIMEDTTNSEVAIYCPSYNLFGQKVLNVKVKNPIILGYKLYYINCASYNIECYDLLYNSYEIVLKSKDEMRPSCFCVDKNNCMFIMNNRHFLVTLKDINKNGVEPSIIWEGNIECTQINQIMLADFGQDHMHKGSDLATSHVKTYYADQMNHDELSLRKIMMDFSETLYDDDGLNEDVMNIMNNESKNVPLHGLCRGNVYNNIFVGDDVHDLFNIPENMFKSYRNYQHINKLMAAFYNDYDDYERVSKNIQKIKDSGINILPRHVFSGKFHLIYPGHGKGWHHNIESVPQKDVRVLYFVCTDKSHFGGSFFLYRHPVSGLIHAVPDVNGTMKEFYLQSHPDKVLWHAIGSFTARRVSMGLSHRQHMQNFKKLNRRLF